MVNNKAMSKVFVISLLVTVVVLAALLVSVEGTPPGLVGYWKFDEGQGNVAQDSSIYGNDGILGDGYCQPGQYICPAWTTDTPSGKKYALSFGEFNYVTTVDCGKDPSLNITEDLTLAAWIKARELPSSEFPIAGILEKFCPPTHHVPYSLYLDDSGNPVFFLGNGSFAGATVASSVPVTLNNWHHVAATVNGTTMKVYVDGVETNTGTFTGIRQDCWNYGSLYISNGPGGAYFNGTIDEVKMWNKALTEKEIRREL